MEEKLITHETAKLAKEKGFDNVKYKEYEPYYKKDGTHVVWHTLHGKRNEEEVCCEIPTQSLLQKWLREKHNILVIPDYDVGKKVFFYWLIQNTELRQGYYKEFTSWEESFEKGLLEGLKLIK